MKTIAQTASTGLFAVVIAFVVYIFAVALSPLPSATRYSAPREAPAANMTPYPTPDYAGAYDAIGDAIGQNVAMRFGGDLATVQSDMTKIAKLYTPTVGPVYTSTPLPALCTTPGPYGEECIWPIPTQTPTPRASCNTPQPATKCIRPTPDPDGLSE